MPGLRHVKIHERFTHRLLLVLQWPCLCVVNPVAPAAARLKARHTAQLKANKRAVDVYCVGNATGLFDLDS